MKQSITIQKNPVVEDSRNYELLRQRGLDYIQQLGSSLWTDYNIHDPGITILELLCYAITDLGYRTSFDIKDLIADKPNEISNPQRQAFYTAREILTVNPWTPADYRKLLIDIVGVKNAWVSCITGACDGISLCVNCKDSMLEYKMSGVPCVNEEVIIKGLYDILVQFDDEEGSGDLNSGKIKSSIGFFDEVNMLHTATIEIRLPSWYLLQQDKEKYKGFRNHKSVIQNISVDFISGNKGDNVSIPDDELSRALRRPLYVTFKITYAPDIDQPAMQEEMKFEDVPFSIWFNVDDDRKLLKLKDITAFFEDISTVSIMAKYLDKIKRADEVINEVASSLQSHRNLCEDYCNISAINTEDIAVCADVEVESSADIEEVLAQVYYFIDQYFSPDIKFYSLKELIDAGKPVDEIFEGPTLSNGFIDDAQLSTTDLKTVLYTSDIINLIIDIPGIRSVKNFSLVRYNNDGFISESTPWSMEVSPNHQPRLYIEGSKFLVFKNGLPFLPDMQELFDTIQVLRGRFAQPQYGIEENDLAVHQGTWFDLKEYHPIQYDLPLTYGVGYAGLPSTASVARKAQAKQLKAYLLFYEQILVNYLEQLANLKELFAVDYNVTDTIFSCILTNDDIINVEELYSDLTKKVMDDLMGNSSTFADRRNRLLDHLLSRFAEQFNDYALMLYSSLDCKEPDTFKLLTVQYPFLTNFPFRYTYADDQPFTDCKSIADNMLIADKIAFLKDLPFMSKNRARSFDYKNEEDVCSHENIAGLKTRIMRVLGIGEFDSYFVFTEEKDTKGKIVGYRWYLRNDTNGFFLFSAALYSGISSSEARIKLNEEIKAIRAYITNITNYEIKPSVTGYELNLLDDSSQLIATAGKQFNMDEAEKERDNVIAFATTVFAEEKIFVVEHILLRPRNIPAGTFQLYEEKDVDSKQFEQKWRLIDQRGKIYLSSSTKYFDSDFATAKRKAKAEILEVCKRITNPERHEIKKEIKWVLNLLNETGEVIATREQHFTTREDAERARDELIGFARSFFIDQQLLRDGTKPGDVLLIGDPLLPICTPPDCSFCGEQDPYSFRLTVVINGEVRLAGSSIDFRRFAEQTIRREVPAHIGVKICWVSTEQLNQFEGIYCAWLTELAHQEPDALELHNKLDALISIFKNLKSVYPKATLHDCIDGNDNNRTFLDQTII
jgi:hypothetical protein